MAEPIPDAFNLTRWIISIAAPTLSGLSGVIIGSWLSSRQHQKKQRLEFIEQQLSCFYSPLLGIRDEIRMLSELRQKISQSADYHWKKICKNARESGGTENLRHVTDERRDEFMKAIEYDNKQLTESLLPSYRKMAIIFRENYYLAENETRDFFKSLIEFIDIWDRWLDKSIPYEVIEEFGYGEKLLHPFYENLEIIHNKLRDRLANM